MKKILFLVFVLGFLNVKSQCDTTLSISVTPTQSGGTATWAAVTGAVTYSWAVIPATGSTVSIISGATTSTIVSFSGLNASTAYRFQVVTVCSGSTSQPKRSPFSTTTARVVYTPMTAAGYQYKYLKVDSLLHVSAGDTTIARGDTRPGAIVYKNSDSLFYGWNGFKWNNLGSSTTSLINQNNNKVDTIFYNTDTIFYRKNSVTYGIVLGFKPLIDNKLNIVDTIGFATRSWSNNVHPRFDGTYNNPTWLNTLHSDKIVNYSATPFQALVSDGNGFFVPYTIPYVSTFDTAAMLANYLRKHDIAGVSGRVPFYTGTTTLSSNANYVWDNTNNWLGIGGNPLTNFHIQTPGGTAANLRLHQNGWNSWNLRSVASSTGFAIGDDTNNYFNIYSTGNVSIGNSNNGFKFEVVGNARITTGLTLGNLVFSRIPYISTGGLVTDNAGFTFDEATNRLRLGGANPILRFDPTVNSNANGLQWQTFGNNDASLNYNVSTGRFVINTGRNSTYGSRQSFNVDSTDVLVLQKATAIINVPLFYPNLGSIQSGNSFSFANWGNKSSLQTTINYSLDGKLGLFNPNPSASLDLSRSARVRGGLFVDTTKSVSQIYCVGDSKTFIGIYERKLNELLGTNWNTNNKGVNGANTFGINTNFNRDVVEAGDADYVVIEAGINDIAQGFTFNDIKTNLQAMYTKAKNAGVAVVAVTISPFKNNASWTLGRQTILENVNRWILDTAIDVDFRVNSYAVLGGQGGDAAVLLSAYNSGDNLHLNTAGYELLGTTIFSNATFTTKNFNGSAIKSTGDIEIFDSNKGAILKSPNGTRFRITVNNAGVLTTTAL